MRSRKKTRSHHKSASRRGVSEKIVLSHLPSLFHLGQRCREVLSIVLVAGSVFILFALLTYHAADPAWSNHDTQALVGNAEGVVGAWIADVLFHFFSFLLKTLEI